MKIVTTFCCGVFMLAVAFFTAAHAAESKYADSNGVKIHYMVEGEGPLVVLIHGFPDYWYSWRDLMPALSDKYRVAALDLRGYNLSEQPQGVENYAFPLLIGDVLAVIKAEGETSANVVGHDWGAAIAWQTAMHAPDFVDNLIILSVPHPAGFQRELATNPSQQENSQYARDFQKEGAEALLTAEGLAQIVGDDESRSQYVEAFERSDFAGMLNYYRANYPGSIEESQAAAAAVSELPRIKAPVLVIHGIKDVALAAGGHDGTWRYVDADSTVLMLPEAGHFVQHDAAGTVNSTIRSWLDLRNP